MREIIGNTKHTDRTTKVSAVGTVDVDGLTGSLYVHDGVIVGGRLVSHGLPRIATAAGPITVLPTDGNIYVKKTVGAATTVTMEANPQVGALHTIKDEKGDAATNPVTIVAASGTIEGGASLVINTNRGLYRLEYNGFQWVSI